MYQSLNDTSRSNMARFRAVYQSDDILQNRWYRFNGGKHSQAIQTKCIERHRKCGALSPGWMKGRHPTGDIIQFSQLVN